MKLPIVIYYCEGTQIENPCGTRWNRFHGRTRKSLHAAKRMIELYRKEYAGIYRFRLVRYAVEVVA